MSNTDRLIELLDEAKARPAGAVRDSFLDEACQDDKALRDQIVSLIEADAKNRNPDFLKHKIQFRHEALVTEKPGDKIGRYKLLQQLGEGGCGVVYMAEQEEPVRRRVALKVIKLGMDTKSVIARFEAERQALALMDHPNIAKVLDAGATETGRPFFVMELVRGIKITDYCDQNNLTTDQRLELFTQVCHAVQHAHQKGIIHRDLKPSNILVTLHDGVPVPKVIDFGVAKATSDQRLTDKTVFTAFEQFIGTPAYMSPEQAEMSGLDIDTRSDIYSLGVLLYELLTGRTPLDPEELLRSGMNEMRRKIREDEPPRPSTRLSTMQAADLTTIAKHRQADAPKLIHLVHGDLDWIVMKCLEKDRTRRYETANGLATDIKRHLGNEPVIARPPSRAYQFQKLVRRNKLVFGAASAVVAALVLGLGVSTWMFFKEKQARQRAVAAEQEQSRLRRQAEAEAAETRRVATFLGNLAENLHHNRNPAKSQSDAYRVSLAMWMRLLGKQHPEIEAPLSSLAQALQQGKLAETNMTARTAVQKYHAALPQFEKLASDRTHHYDAWLIAVAHEVLAQLFKESGQTQEAEKVYRDTQVLWRKMVADFNIEDDRFHLANNYDALGILLRESGRATESLEAYRAAQAIWLKLVAEFNDEDRRLHLAGTDGELGQLLKEAGRFDEAIDVYRQAVAVLEKLVAEFDKDFYQIQLSFTMSRLAATLQAAGRLAEAENLAREALAMNRKRLGNEHPQVANSLNVLGELLVARGKAMELPELLRELPGAETAAPDPALVRGHLLWKLGDAYSKQEQFKDAEGAYDQALQQFKQLQVRFPTNVYYRQEQAGSLRLLSDVMQRTSRLAEAEASLRTAWDIYTQLAKEMPTSTWYAQEAAFTHRRIAEVLNAQGKLEESEKMYREALATAKKQFGDAHREVDYALGALARVLQQEGKLAEAEAVRREELAVERKLSGDEHPFVANSLQNLAAVLEAQGKLNEAETVSREALAMRRKLLGNEHPDVATALAQLTAVLLAEKKFIEAEPVARECLAIRETKLPDDWLTFNARTMLGGSLLGQKKYTEAEPSLLSSYEGLKRREDKIPATSKVRLQESLQRLVQLYQATDQPEKAAEWTRKLAEFEQAAAAKKTADKMRIP